MKKSLIALAALSTMAGSAVAQSSATAYGVLSMGYTQTESVTAAGVKTKGKQMAGSDDTAVTNRLGFRAVEDLGGGLKGGFHWETRLSPSSSTNAFTNANSNRIAEVYLESAAMGKIAAGRNATVTNQIANGFEPFGAASGTGVVKTANADDRFNRIVYSTPKIANTQLHIGGVQSESSSTTTSGSKGNVVAVTYSNGPIAAAAGYTKVRTRTDTVAAVTATSVTSLVSGTVAGGAGSNSTYNTTTTITAEQAATDSETKDIAIGVTYTFNNNVAYLRYQDQEITNKLTGAQSSALKDAYLVGIKVPVGKLDLLASYSIGKTQAASTAAEFDNKAYQAGLKYNFSKRTAAYAIYGDESVDTATNPVKTKITMMGLTHQF